MFIKAVALTGSLLFVATPVAAQSAGDAPAAAPAVTPICTDRPTKANAACTVPAGAVQIETDAVNWTTTTDGGVRTDVVLYTNPTVKLGLGPRTDIEVNIAPYVTARTRVGGTVDRIDGVGDLYIRLKQQLVATDKVAISLLPFIKAPTARLGIGNKRVEGGLAAPVVFTLPDGFALNVGPELDLLADGDRDGRHLQLVTVANLAKTIGKATLYAEFWNAQNFDPAGTVHQYSLDAAVAYLVAPTVQLDVGANFGLNRTTPDAQVYAGLSTRF